MTTAQRILIIEDEPLISMMLEDFIDVLGHAVAGTADNVSDALVAVESGELDAAILDINLRGGEKSWPVADALASAGIPFVLATGGAGDSIAAEHRHRPTLAKPFTLESVRGVLNALG